MAKPDDEEFLSAFDPWLRGHVRRLLRIEERGSGEIRELDTEAMPPWAVELTGKVMASAGFKPTRHDYMTVRYFGRLLGGKVALSWAASAITKAWDKANDGTRAKLTRALGGPQGIKVMRSFARDYEDLDRVRTAVLKRTGRLTPRDQGEFYRSYGEGLLAPWRLQRQLPPRVDKHNYMVLFAVLHWSKLQDLAQSGGWNEVREFFARNQGEDRQIGEDAFVKMLQLAGMTSGLERGRPRKTGRKSS